MPPRQCPNCIAAERDLVMALLELAKLERTNRQWQKEFNLDEHPIPLTPSLKAITRAIRRLREGQNDIR